MMDFYFKSGTWENATLPTILRENPDGGDPHILATIKRVHNPDGLYELCRLANTHNQAQARIRELEAALSKIVDLVADTDPDSFEADKQIVYFAIQQGKAALTSSPPAPVKGESEELRAALAAADAAAPLPIELRDVERTLNEWGSSWISCTGCHETSDGAETGYYPYSAILKCYLGAGCQECGGIGAVPFYAFDVYETEPASQWRDIKDAPRDENSKILAWLKNENRPALLHLYETSIWREEAYGGSWYENADILRFMPIVPPLPSSPEGVE